MGHPEVRVKKYADMIFETSGKKCKPNLVKGEGICPTRVFLNRVPGHVFSTQNKCRYLLTPVFMIFNEMVENVKLNFIDWGNFAELTNQDETGFMGDIFRIMTAVKIMLVTWTVSN